MNKKTYDMVLRRISFGLAIIFILTTVIQDLVYASQQTTQTLNRPIVSSDIDPAGSKKTEDTFGQIIQAQETGAAPQDNGLPRELADMLASKGISGQEVKDLDGLLQDYNELKDDFGFQRVEVVAVSKDPKTEKFDVNLIGADRTNPDGTKRIFHTIGEFEAFLLEQTKKDCSDVLGMKIGNVRVIKWIKEPSLDDINRNYSVSEHFELPAVTGSASTNAYRFSNNLKGGMTKDAADGAASEKVAENLQKTSLAGVVVIGEGERDEAPMLAIGLCVGGGFNVLGEVKKTRHYARHDIAMDVLELTNGIELFVIKGTISIVVVARKGWLFGCSDIYMMKFAVSPEAADGDISLFERDKNGNSILYNEKGNITLDKTAGRPKVRSIGALLENVRAALQNKRARLVEMRDLKGTMLCRLRHLNQMLDMLEAGMDISGEDISASWDVRLIIDKMNQIAEDVKISQGPSGVDKKKIAKKIDEAILNELNAMVKDGRLGLTADSAPELWVIKRARQMLKSYVITPEEYSRFAKIIFELFDKRVKKEGMLKIGNMTFIADGDLMPVFGLIPSAEGQPSEIDFLWGVGGAPEGVLAQALIECLGGRMRAVLCAYECLKEGAMANPETDYCRYTVNPDKNIDEISNLAKNNIVSPEKAAKDPNLISWNTEFDTSRYITGQAVENGIGALVDPYKGITIFFAAIKDSVWIKQMKGIMVNSENANATWHGAVVTPNYSYLIEVVEDKGVDGIEKRIRDYKDLLSKFDKEDIAAKALRIAIADLYYKLGKIFGDANLFDTAYGYFYKASEILGQPGKYYAEEAYYKGIECMVGGINPDTGTDDLAKKDKDTVKKRAEKAVGCFTDARDANDWEIIRHIPDLVEYIGNSVLADDKTLINRFKESGEQKTLENIERTIALAKDEIEEYKKYLEDPTVTQNRILSDAIMMGLEVSYYELGRMYINREYYDDAKSCFEEAGRAVGKSGKYNAAIAYCLGLGHINRPEGVRALEDDLGDLAAAKYFAQARFALSRQIRDDVVKRLNDIKARINLEAMISKAKTPKDLMDIYNAASEYFEVMIDPEKAPRDNEPYVSLLNEVNAYSDELTKGLGNALNIISSPDKAEPVLSAYYKGPVESQRPQLTIEDGAINLYYRKANVSELDMTELTPSIIKTADNIERWNIDSLAYLMGKVIGSAEAVGSSVVVVGSLAEDKICSSVRQKLIFGLRTVGVNVDFRRTAGELSWDEIQRDQYSDRLILQISGNGSGYYAIRLVRNGNALSGSELNKLIENAKGFKWRRDLDFSDARASRFSRGEKRVVEYEPEAKTRQAFGQRAPYDRKAEYIQYMIDIIRNQAGITGSSETAGDVLGSIIKGLSQIMQAQAIYQRQI